MFVSKKRRFLLGGILSIFIFLTVIWKLFLIPTLIEIPITFSNKQLPLIQVAIQGKEYPFNLFLSSKYPLFIQSSELESLNKKDKGKASWKNINGETFVASLYELPRIQSGPLKIDNVLVVSSLAKEETKESIGEIKWPLDKLNLFLDFPHGRMVGINREKDFGALGYDINKAEKVKCEITQKGVLFKAMTSLGELKVALSTSCNVNIINSSKVDKSIQQITSQFKIGNRDFGPIHLTAHNISPELEFDAILGSEFLKRHIVYVDAHNKYLYIGEAYWNSIAKNSLSKIPLDFTYDGLPVIEMEINKKKHKVVLDLGCSSEFLSPSEHFSTDSLRYINTSRSFNVLGEEEEVKYYDLPRCILGGYVLNHLIIGGKKEIGVDLGIKGGGTGTMSSKALSYIGFPLLNRTNIYFDFPRSSLWLINQNRDLDKIGVRLEEFEKIPIESERDGIIVHVTCDLGNLRLLLDTGCGASLIKSELLKEKTLTKDALENLCFFSNTFQLGKSNYAQAKLYPFDISPSFENIDGILGMDFLGSYAFYIDYENKLLYLQKPL